MITKIGGEGNTLGYEVSGKISEEEYQRMIDELRVAIAQYGEINVLSRLPDSGVPGMELSVIDDDLRFAKDHTGDIRRMAVVGGSTTAEWMAKASDKLTGIDVRHFSTADEPQAWAWLRQSDRDAARR